jgi:predicted secreted protein
VVNNQLENSLPGNPTTGNDWLLNAIDVSIVKPQGETEYISKTEAIGAVKRYIFCFKAIAMGETWVEIVYRCPFDPSDVSTPDEHKIYVKVSK